MKTIRVSAVVVGLLVVVGGLWSTASAQKATCKDIPIRWFIYPVATMPDGSTVPSAISGDGNWYAPTAGTTNTVIHVCGSSATGDATVALGSKRKFTAAFPAPVTGSATAESVTGSYQNSGFINVRNIVCYDCTKAPFEPFTTHVALQLYGLLTSRDNYRLRFMPPVVDAPDRHIDPAIIPAENTPYESAPALVLPQPYDCATGGTTKPSWIVRGTNTSADPNLPPGETLQVGTLARIDSKGVRYPAGQYSMPFEIRIEALTCFTY